MTLRPSRRDFIAGGVGAGLSLPLLGDLAPHWLSAANAGWDQKLVILQLNGGNDWINNLVNPDESVYQAARPQLALPKAKMIQLNTTDPHYLHPRLAAFKTLYDQGRLALFPGYGYKVPNLSHFRSMDIMAEGDETARNVRAGWLGEVLSKVYTGAAQIEALNIENRLNRHFIGHPVPVLQPNSLSTFAFSTDSATRAVDGDVELALLESNAKVLRPTAIPNLRFLADAIGQAPSDSLILQTAGGSYTPKATYPSATTQDRYVRDRLQFVARYIVGGLQTPIYMTSLGGWDTHANEVDATDNTLGNHADLLGAVADNVKAFLDDLKAWSKDSNVTVLVQSEFGRRVGENGNLGCDHGFAGIAYLAGATIKNAGVRTTFPDWSKVSTPYNRAHFQYTTMLDKVTPNHFLSMYATLIEKLWGADSTKVLGAQWPLHDVFG